MRAYLYLIPILLLAAWLRLDAMTQDVRFHSDEALYSTYARNAAVHGDWMLSGPVDKPPLTLYGIALGMHFFAASVNDLNVIDVPPRLGEFAAFTPGFFAGLITVALVFALALTLYGQKSVTTALLAALLVAVSPYAVAYSASAFTDAPMLVFMTASVLAAARERPGWSGLLMGLSFASKPQGLLYVPLVAGIYLLRNVTRSRRDLSVAARNCALGLGVVLAALLIWDTARPETSVFVLGSVNISQDRFFVRPDEWLPRLETWLAHGDVLLGLPLLTAALTLAGITFTAINRDRRDGLLLVWIIGFGLLHWMAAFFTFDRYLLPLVPVLALLAARALVGVWHQAGKRPALLAALIAGILLLSLPAQHDPRADVFRSTSPDGFFRAADFLNSKSLGAIIYDRWLGWEMGYYMGAWSDKRRVYYPEPVQMARDARCNSDPAPRYLLAPADEDVTRWLAELNKAGFASSRVYDRDRFVIYELIPPWAASGASASGSSWQRQGLCDDGSAS
jgi:4-amino-4-deoxy-L-arabinose transferase-like glycosyltransferase